MTAEALGIEVEERRYDLEFAVTTEDLDFPAGKYPIRRPGVEGVNREKTHMASGMVGTAMPAVNAIPIVCRAAPGVRRVDGLPLITARGLLF